MVNALYHMHEVKVQVHALSGGQYAPMRGGSHHPLVILSPPKLASDLLRDKKAAEEYLRPVRKWSFRRIVVSHGIALENNAQAEFRRAFAKYRGATS